VVVGGYATLATTPQIGSADRTERRGRGLLRSAGAAGTVQSRTARAAETGVRRIRGSTRRAGQCHPPRVFAVLVPPLAFRRDLPAPRGDDVDILHGPTVPDPLDSPWVAAASVMPAADDCRRAAPGVGDLAAQAFPDANLLLLAGREPVLVDSGFVGHADETAAWAPAARPSSGTRRAWWSPSSLGDARQRRSDRSTDTPS
jgi:hypothetical protein